MTGDASRGELPGVSPGGGSGEPGIESRLAALEEAARLLADQTARLAARIDGIERRTGAVGHRPPAVPADPPAAARPLAAPTRPPAWKDLEAFIGRYGILGLGTLTVLAAVGTFVRWAIAHGILGPEARVSLGLLFAAALAAGGIQLRRRERAFGSVLLGLALAVTHVCAWAAGPLLHVVPDGAAFGLAVVASLVLSVFAHMEDEQPLWCVGFGGVAVAPFVTSAQGGNATALAIYGTMIAIAGGYALGARPWRIAEAVFLTGVGLFVAALVGMPNQHGPEFALWLPLVVAAAGVLPFASADRVRTRLRTPGVFAAVAALVVPGARSTLHSAATATWMIGAAGIVWLALLDRVAAMAAVQPTYRGSDVESFAVWTDAAFVPFAIACAAAEAAPASAWSASRAMAAGAVVLAVFVWRRAPGFLRDASAFAAAGCAIFAVAVVPWDTITLLPVALAILAAAFTGAYRVRPTRSWVVMAALALVIGCGRAWWLMHAREAFAYVPFFTAESASAAGALVAWVAAVALAPLPADGSAGDAATLARFVRAGSWCWAFVWVHRELADAFSRPASTLSLVSLEALTAVLVVWAGRAGDARALRRVGLGLAIIAALRALSAAHTVEAVGLRIASYLVASAFLLGIAYWYRRREGEPAW